MKESVIAEDRNLKEYYSLRSGEYDLLYDRPNRQADLRAMENAVVESLSGKRVLEIACGTGYWTELLADHVESLLAIDTSDEMMKIARKRTGSKENVMFLKSDAYSLDNVEGKFDAAFCGYWVSHVRRNRMREFLESLHGKLLPGSRVVLLDNRYVDGESTPVSKTDSEGNTYQLRKISDGTSYEIVKNFFDEDELRKVTEGIGSDAEFLSFQFYWIFQYDTFGNSP